MRDIHVALHNQTLNRHIKKALSSDYKVKFWEDTDQLLASLNLSPDDIARVDEHWAARHLAAVNGMGFPMFIVLLSASEPDASPENLTSRALAYMEYGASECLTLEAEPKEIKGVIDFAFATAFKRRPPQTPRTKMASIAAMAVVLVGLTLGTIFHYSSSQISGLNAKGTHKIFHILTPSPYGIAVDGNRVLIADWTHQTVTTYRATEEMNRLHAIKFEDFSLISLCFGDGGLWSLGHDLWIRFHELNRNLSVTRKLQIEGFNLAGLGWDGTDLWSLDTTKNAIVRIEIGEKAVVKDSFPIKTQKPVGLVMDGRKLWVMDGQNGELLYFERTADGWDQKSSRIIPFFAGDMNRAAGFGGDGKTLWITAENSGLVYCLRI